MKYKPIALAAAVLLVVALADLPYGYYTFLRIFVCGAAIFGVLKARAEEQDGWVLPLAAVAVLFNPIFPIYLNREIWAVLDLGSAGIMAASAFYVSGAE